MKKLVLHYINLPLILGALSASSYALEVMDDNELSATTGEGLGVIIDNLSIHSADKGQPGDFEIILDLNETLGQEQLIFSELRIHKTGTVSGAADSGGNFGTVSDPVYLGDLREIDVFTGVAADPTDTTVSAITSLRTEFPGSILTQVDRSAKAQENNPGAFATAAALFESNLSAVTDKFNGHIRFDDFIAANPVGMQDNFRAMIDIEGLRLYGTYTDIFATEGKGISLASSVGLFVDKISVSTSLPTAASKLAASAAGDYVTTPSESRLIFNGIDVYTTLGTRDQPLTFDNVTDANGNNQLQMEISPLPASVGIAPKSNIYVKSIYFGEKYNEDLRTGLRAGATPGSTNPADYHYAFQPDVGNTIEIKGMQVQHLRITTMDI